MLNLENKIGVSTACFYPELTETAFDQICKLDVRVCEIFINTQSETKLDYLRDIKLKAEDNNIKIVSVHPYFSGHEQFLFFSDYKRRFFDSIELYKPMFEAAQFLGSEYILCHGGMRNVNFGLEEYSERFLIIAEEAKKYNCELLQENIGDRNDYIQDLSKDIRFTLDFKHAVHWGYDILEIIEKMGNNIAHIHLNDMVADYDSLEASQKVRNCRLPFAGVLNYTKIFEKLADINYIGDFIIEVYKYSYENISEISESINKFREFLKSRKN